MNVNPAILALCWVVIEGIELLGCGLQPWFFCFITSAVLRYLIGAYSLPYSFVCGGIFAFLCTFPNRAAEKGIAIGIGVVFNFRL